MPVITFAVGRARDKWAVLHHDLPLATFETREEAERAALALAAHHPQDAAAEVAIPQPDGELSQIRVF